MKKIIEIGQDCDLRDYALREIDDLREQVAEAEFGDGYLLIEFIKD